MNLNWATTRTTTKRALVTPTPATRRLMAAIQPDMNNPKNCIDTRNRVYLVWAPLSATMRA